MVLRAVWGAVRKTTLSVIAMYKIRTHSMNIFYYTRLVALVCGMFTMGAQTMLEVSHFSNCDILHHGM